jgi:chitinase
MPRSYSGQAMQSGLLSLATVLMFATTGCGQLGGVCDDCGAAGSSGSGGSAGGASVEPGVVPAGVKPIPEGKLVIGYLPTWGAPLTSYATDQLLSRLTHVAIAFAEVDPNGVYFTNPNDVRNLVAKAHSFNVKVLVSIGGASGSEEITLEIVPDKLPTFVAHTMKLIDDYGLDGVDVDLEGGGVDGNYGPLVAALNTELDMRGMQISAAVGNWFSDRIPQSALDTFDFVSVMAYDECGSWTQACPHSSMDLAQSQIAFWVESRGVPASKMILGVPFYGYQWNASGGETVAYSTILSMYPDAWQTDWIDDGGTKLSYNGEATIKSKVALSQQYGGVMIWDLASDAAGDRSLLKAVNDSY